MSAKVYFTLRTDRPQEDGSAQVYFIFLLNRNQRMKFATGKFIALKNEYKKLTPAQILEIPQEKREMLYCWDSEKQRATKGTKNIERLNYYFTSEEKRANDIILSYQIQNKTLSIEIFKKKFFKPTGTQNFKEYFTNEVEEVRKNTLEENSKKVFRWIFHTN